MHMDTTTTDNVAVNAHAVSRCNFVRRECMFVWAPIIYNNTSNCHLCCIPLLCGATQPPKSTYSTPAELDTLLRAREANKQQAKVSHY